MTSRSTDRSLEVEFLITMPMADSLLARLNELAPRVKANLIPAQKPEDVPAEVWSRTEVLYTNRIIPTAEQAPRLRWIQFHWAGVDHTLDAPILKKPGVMATTLISPGTVMCFTIRLASCGGASRQSNDTSPLPKLITGSRLEWVSNS